MPGKSIVEKGTSPAMGRCFFPPAVSGTLIVGLKRDVTGGNRGRLDEVAPLGMFLFLATIELGDRTNGNPSHGSTLRRAGVHSLRVWGVCCHGI